MNPLGWLRENARVYFGNATSRRDYRAQLRGPRAIYFWAVYLLILVLLAGSTYSAIMDTGERPVAELQDQLQQFYDRSMRLLSILLMLIAPALTATSIVSEKMMKSLDLVFTSPMTTKHLLVGKMISSFRYTWMLLILALPITAVSVVMGGATWTDVLAGYVILSASALVATSIGLLISSLVNTPVAAMLWTYLAVGFYSFLTASAADVVNSPIWRGASGPDQQAPWFFALSPFYAVQSAPTHTLVGSWHVPNYLIAVVFAILVSKLMLLGAASALSPFGAKETKSLRLHLLAYALGAAYLVGRSVDTGNPGKFLVEVGGTIAVALCILLPFVICGSRYADRKYRLDQPINLVAAIDGRPSGALPFLCCLAAALTGGFTLGAQANRGVGDIAFTATLWIMAFWAFWWAVGRATSVATPELRVSRMLLIVMMLALIGLPVALASLGPSNQLFEDTTVWRYYILHPLGHGGANMEAAGLEHSIGLVGASALIATCAEIVKRKKHARGPAAATSTAS